MIRLLAVLSAAALLSGCGGTASAPAVSAEPKEKLQVTATVFPAYDFARAVCGDLAEVTLLLPPGAESHSYEPTPQDILTVGDSDLFLYLGGESDAWVETLLDSIDGGVQ
ncbi:metal ABC transporter substrate-binding protein, partial [Oscillibacter ruminantium]